MTQFRADLHCHSTCSDGSETPEQLAHLAMQKGLSGLSITDHDCIDAYKTALPLAKQLGLKIISGVEFSTNHQGTSVHVLAYAFPLDNSAIANLCKRHETRRQERNHAILELLRKKGMPIDEKIIENKQYSIGRPHIAKAMIAQGYVKNIDEAFYKYIGDGKCCYVSGNPVSTEETLSIIHSAGGLAVIAHPHLFRNPQTIHLLLELPFDGIECYYARFSRTEEQPWVTLAQSKNLLITGGSDFHGTLKPEIQLGASWVDEMTFKILEQHQSHVS